MPTIDLNADLGEGYGPWAMGDDAAMFGLISSASVACGGHAGDAETMFASLNLAQQHGVTVGAHPGYADKAGFGRRVIPMTAGEIGRMVAGQMGALLAIAALTGRRVRYIKPHGALANLAAVDADVAEAILAATRAVDPDLAVLAISGTMLEQRAATRGFAVYSEIFADRGYLPNGQLVPRQHQGAMIHDPETALSRLLRFMDSGRMAVVDGPPIALRAQSICVHGDNPQAVGMARRIREGLAAQGVTIRCFVG
ncbi:LamB/YcsF family protein [Neogemmobacter tilapiae]|nr:5-oxoprolinase subunit PxpA [Gemmobacter tilapiae]